MTSHQPNQPNQPQPSQPLEEHPDLTLCDSGTYYNQTLHCCELFAGHQLPHQCADPSTPHQVIKWTPNAPSTNYRLALEGICVAVILFSVLATTPALAFLAIFGLVAIHLLCR